MFDALLQNPLVLALPPALSIAFAFLLSRLIELVPKFAAWWDKQANEYKLAYRGWSGLVLSVVLVIFGYFTEFVTFEVGTVKDWLVLVGSVLVAWFLFVNGAESTYQFTKANLPRKQPQWAGPSAGDSCC
jgi:hypothetical protein